MQVFYLIYPHKGIVGRIIEELASSDVMKLYDSRIQNVFYVVSIITDKGTGSVDCIS